VQILMSAEEAERLREWLVGLGQLPPVAIALLSALTQVVAEATLSEEAPMA